MGQLERFGVSMDADLLAQFDGAIAAAGYANRSEALRDLARDYLVGRAWEDPQAEVVATVTLIYDHHTREVSDGLNDLQHDHGEAVICSTHVHLDHHHCLEVVVLRGPNTEVRALADRLLSTRGVKHGGLTATVASHLP